MWHSAIISTPWRDSILEFANSNVDLVKKQCRDATALNCHRNRGHEETTPTRHCSQVGGSNKHASIHATAATASPWNRAQSSHSSRRNWLTRAGLIRWRCAVATVRSPTISSLATQRSRLGSDRSQRGKSTRNAAASGGGVLVLSINASS